ncbi:MAG: ATP synthase F1 subunit epsilon [Sphingomonadaceae bacterium]|uniref:ATP synthase F1 subunit epsilon n=1 Tax=Thermaurantiacus sp. TaxID=2820283 RepID=UPI00298F0EFD|nr:ATP synthase F1 subunit epsilon [Thermaurantiacus sp.]MCS6985935.1 ATP synthase F1 subunit epsilon [Sphingomonadaceae bacterium]MDW8414849.1 ATP synthase F1 subunit epsilon [Thermaurantiacus sp.]
MGRLHLDIVTPVKRLRSAEVHMVVVPGAEGDFGVLAGHAPVLSTLRPGFVEIYASPGAEPQRIPVDGGLAEVNASSVTILTGDIPLLG